MTFSARIKEELSTIELKSPECALAECCGMILFANTVTPDRIKIITENKNVALRASRILKTLFGFDFDKKIIPETSFKKFNLIIEHPSRISEIFEAIGINADDSLSLHLNAALVEADETRSAFCRGAFLTGGSASDPSSRYHLELVTSHSALSREVISLLLELELPAKLASRKSNNIIYLKESRYIEEFLTRIGAPLSAIELMQAKLMKDVRNQVNRQVNFEVANLLKASNAGELQVLAIKKLQKFGKLDSLSPQLREAARLRLLHPEASLSELASFSEDGVGKSGLNHRLNKLVSIANELDSRKDS